MSASATQGGHNDELDCGAVGQCYVMAALRDIGGALCSTPQSLAHAHYQSGVQQRYQDALVAKIQPDKVVRWCPDGEFSAIFCVLHFQRAACSTFPTCVLNSH